MSIKCSSLLLQIGIYIIISLNTSGLSAQTDPVFTSFDGTVYEMPKMLQKIRGHLTRTILEKYSDKVLDYDSLTTISLSTLDIPETYIQYGSFPYVPRKTKFCMLLDSRVVIPTTAYYQFSLNSDDGSILWIDDNIIVDNDGGHPMRKKSEVVLLKQGEYPVKLWYFQGHPDGFGLEMAATYYGPLEEEQEDSTAMVIEKELPSDLLFESNSAVLSKNAESYLRQFLSKKKLERYTKIEVIGHTDDIGSDDDNLMLSKQRAQSVASLIQDIFPLIRIEYEVIGEGEQLPKYSNQSEEGRTKNRRVEIKLF